MRKMNVMARAAACAALLGLIGTVPAWAASDQQQQSVQVLQDTVINLLQALVQRGVITQQQAEQMVKQAQDKANADLAATRAKERAQREQEEKEGAIAVPYVPQIVQQKIARQVAAQVQPAVTSDVLKQAKKEGWGVPGAMPDWIRKVRIAGDMTLRGQDNLYGSGNSDGCPAGTPYGNCTILDFNAINAAGGITQAGVNAFLNINQDQELFRARARFGVEMDFTDSIDGGIRLATGSLNVPISQTQTLGNEFGRYTVGLDRLYLRWQGRTGSGFPYLMVIGGKFPNPFFSPTKLVYDSDDLEFDGGALTGRLGLGFGGKGADQSSLWLTLGGFPIQEVALVAQNDKWMVGGQIGTTLRFGDGPHFTLAGAYYDFVHVQGIPNSYDSTLDNYSVPLFVTHGNTMCPISNLPTGSTQELFGLCAQYQIADISAGYVQPIGRYALTVNAEADRNVGYSTRDIERLFGQVLAGDYSYFAPRTKGYVADLGFGDPTVFQAWNWRGQVGYRYVQRDAVLDALTDPDFHGGGTDTQGFYLNGSLGLAEDVWGQLRYFSGRAIDGPRYDEDVIQLDLNARF